VRAFEAAARYQSFARAADELCVTPTAISHQIRLLEEFLQTRLFLRTKGRLELTPAACAAMGRLSSALDEIDDVIGDLLEPRPKQKIVVTASPSVTSLWLLPRLQRFRSMEPGADVVLNIIDKALPQDVYTDIWIASSNTTLDMRVEPMMAETIVPVCAPRMLAACGSREAALRSLPLIHDEKAGARSHGPFPTWERYCAGFGIRREDVRRGLRFTQSSLALDAALEGHGMVLGRSQLIGPALAAGRLVALGEPFPVQFQYFVVSPWEASSPAVNRFRNWLLTEAGDAPRAMAAAPALAMAQ
jgi:LysR family glycine cleavage system transcriptional activator